MLPLYPIFVNLENRNCLVIGGGKVAARKVASLLECGAAVEVISPQVQPELAQWAQEGKIRWQPRPYQEGDEINRMMVFAATGDSGLNQQIAARCRENAVLLNAVDDPPHCDFFVPALARRGKITVAVSSSGSSPLLAAAIRNQLAAALPEEIAVMADILEAVRNRIRSSSLNGNQKKQLYQQILAQNWLEKLQNGNEKEVRENVEQCISSWLDSIIKPPR